MDLDGLTRISTNQLVVEAMLEDEPPSPPGISRRRFGVVVGSMGLLFAMLYFTVSALVFDPKPLEAAVDEEGYQVRISIENYTFDVTTSAQTVRELLAELGLKIEPSSRVSPPPESQINSRTHVCIHHPYKVTINDGGEKSVVETFAQTVRGVLQEQQVKLNDQAEVKPGLKKQITDDATIIIYRFSEELVDEEESIPFETVYQDDPDTLVGNEYEVQAGSMGTKIIHKKLIYKNGELESEEILGVEIVEDPVTHIIARGSKEPIPDPVPTPKPEPSECQVGMATWINYDIWPRLGNQGDLTAATYLYPVGTKVRVRSMVTDATIVVTIIDYMPPGGHAIIDLNDKAFEALGLNLSRGITTVCVEQN